MKKCLSLTVIFMLLSLRLGSFAPGIFTISVEDALFQQAFIAGDNPSEGKLIKAKPNIMFELPVKLPGLKIPVIEKAGQPDSPFSSNLILRDILSQIFIPPEILS